MLCMHMSATVNIHVFLRVVDTKIDLSWIDLRSISVRFSVRFGHRINNQPEVRLRVGAFDVGVLAHVASRI